MLTPNGAIANQIAAPLKEQLLQNGLVIDTGFDDPDAIRNLSVHEFGHTFVNPLTALPTFASSIAAYKHLFRPISGQAQYSDWETSFNEHLVRAGEIRIAQKLKRPDVMEKLRTAYANWMYLPFFTAQLQRYESNRKKYPTLAVFLPDLIAALSSIPE
ncbi:hypothetical protein GCM10027185_05040 [Spirosoma pulveris]